MMTMHRHCGLAVLILIVALGACGDDESNPLSPEEEQLVGTWGLDLDQVDADDFAFTYTFGSDHTARNRMGGAFLRRLRDLEALQDVDLGELGDLNEIDGAIITWRGTWSLQTDSLRVVFDRLEVDALGRLPIIGQISIPVYEQDLTADQQTEVAYTYQVTDDRLVLRGAAASAGIADEQAGEQTAGLDPIAQGALQAATDVLLETYQGSDANEFVYLRQ